MGERINRREALGLLGCATVSAAFGLRLAKPGRVVAQGGSPREQLAQPSSAPVPSPNTRLSTAPLPVVIARGGTPNGMVDAVMAGLGGMGAFVPKGARVLVKPNIGWDRAPELAANTNPAVVARVGRGICEARCPVRDQPGIRLYSLGESRNPKNQLDNSYRS
jgi:hypothetical protein